MTGLIERSVSAAGLLIVIFIIRALLLHRLPKITFQILWGVAVLRLLLPYSVELPFEIPLLFSVAEKPAEAGVRSLTFLNAGTQARLTALQGKASESPQPSDNAAYAGTADIYKQNAPANSRNAAPAALSTLSAGTAGWPETNRSALSGIWLAGAALCLLYFTVSHLRCRRLYAQALPVDASALPVRLGRRIRVKVSDRISAPLTYGIIFPVILLPKIADLRDTAQLRMILEHEAVHIRRLDVLYKWIMTVSVCMHWFNPLVWIMYALAGRDMELSCDEAVVKRFESGNRAEYALALLNFEEKRSLSPMFTRFSGNAVKERIEAIMKLNKTSILSAVLAAVLVAGATTVFAAPQSNEDAPASPSESSAPGSGAPSLSDADAGIKQYLCEPSYYTVEEFEACMETERQSIEAEVAAGTLTREGADEALKELDKLLEEVRGGRKVQSPSPVFYSDGTPVINSRGEQLYAKASDIEQINAALRAKAEGNTEALTESESQEADLLLNDWEENLRQGSEGSGAYETAETELEWYTYEEYQEYAARLKEEYAAMLGEWGFDSVRGWYEWTGEVIAEACAQLDSNLQFIQDGGMISKPFDDGAQIMTGIPGAVFQTEESTVESTAIVSALEQDYEDGGALEQGTASYDTAVTAAEGGEWDSELLKAYEPYGITADKKARYFLLNGTPIAGFSDSGFATLVDAEAEECGGIYVKAVRRDGVLCGVEEISAEEFAKLSGLSIK